MSKSPPPKASLPERIRALLQAARTDSDLPLHWGASTRDTQELAWDVLAGDSTVREFEGPEDLLLFISERLDPEIWEDPPPDRIRSLVEALKDPLRAHSFEVPVFVDRAYDMPEASFGSGDTLTLVPAPDKFAPQRLRGIVNAASSEGAVIRVERRLDELFGAMTALGLTRFVLRRETPAERLTVKIDGEERQLATVYADRVACIYLCDPRYLTDTDKVLWASDQIGDAIARPLRQLRRVMAGDSEHASYVRSACRIAMNAAAALDPGIAFSLTFSALEGLLLSEKSDHASITARLTEALAHKLATSLEEREEIRKHATDLYKIRSTFVHSGRFGSGAAARAKAQDVLFSALRTEIANLPALAAE